MLEAGRVKLSWIKQWGTVKTEAESQKLGSEMKTETERQGGVGDRSELCEPEGKSRRGCSPSRRTTAARIPCARTAATREHTSFREAIRQETSSSSQEKPRIKPNNRAPISSRTREARIHTLREPEHPQGDSMVAPLSSSSSWQILHCLRLRAMEEEDEHASSCSILLALYYLPILSRASSPSGASGCWLLRLCSLCL
jgi:hypothetical protein